MKSKDLSSCNWAFAFPYKTESSAKALIYWFSFVKLPLYGGNNTLYVGFLCERANSHGTRDFAGDTDLKAPFRNVIQVVIRREYLSRRSIIPFLSFINRAGISIDFLSVFKVVKRLFKGLTWTRYSSRDQQRQNNKTKVGENALLRGFQNKLYLTSVVKPWSVLQLLPVQDRVSDVTNFTVRVVCWTLIWGGKWVDEIVCGRILI